MLALIKHVIRAYAAMPRPVIFILHGDLDGMAATAIIADSLRRKKGSTEFKFLFSQPHELDKVLQQVNGDFDELYLVDLAIDSELWPKVATKLVELSKKGRVVWIDHHPSTIDLASKLAEIGVETVLEKTKSAATIARRFLSETSDPKFYEDILRLGEASDLAIEIEKEDPLHHPLEVLSMALAYKVRDEKLKRKILATWLNEKIIVPDEVVDAASEGERIFKELYGEATRSIIFDSEKLTIVDLRSRRVYGFAGRIASMIANEKGRPTIVLTRLGEAATLITFRAPTKGSFETISATIGRTARSHGGDGGGHPSAFTYKVPSTLAENILREIIDVVNEPDM
jgi:RecJ-like exonuclease